MAFTKQVILFFAIVALCDHLVVALPFGGEQPIKLVGTIFGGAKSAVSKITGLGGSIGQHNPLGSLIPADGASQLSGLSGTHGLDSLTDPTKLSGLTDRVPGLDSLNQGATGHDALNKAQESAGHLGESVLGSVGKLKPDGHKSPFKLF